MHTHTHTHSVSVSMGSEGTVGRWTNQHGPAELSQLYGRVKDVVTIYVTILDL